MFKVSDLNKRDIVNIVDGSKLGPVKDIHIDVEKGTIEAIILQGSRRFWLFSSRKDFIVPWGAVKKLGKDAVLIEVHDWTV